MSPPSIASTTWIVTSSSPVSARASISIPSEWDLAALRSGSGWTKSGRLLLFEFQNQPEKLTLKLYLGPGPADVRSGLFKMAASNPKVFVKAGKTLTGTWTQLFAREFVTSREYESDDGEIVSTLIKTRWEAFITSDLPVILAELRAQEWVATWTASLPTLGRPA